MREMFDWVFRWLNSMREYNQSRQLTTEVKNVCDDLGYQPVAIADYLMSELDKGKTEDWLYRWINRIPDLSTYVHVHQIIHRKTVTCRSIDGEIEDKRE